MIRFTVRELLVIIAFAAMGIAALRIGGNLATTYMACVGVLCVGLIILALVGIDRNCAFAIGFTVPSLLYIGLVALSDKREFDPYAGRLPTSQLFRPIFASLSSTIYKDVVTEEIYPDYEPSSRFTSAAGNRISAYLSLHPSIFMMTAHATSALLLGLICGKFGSAVYYRQHLDTNSGEP